VRTHSRLPLANGRALGSASSLVRTSVGLLAVPVLAVHLFAAPALAHGGPGIASQPVETPTWLFLLTGGGVIAVSFLLTSFVTDRNVFDGYHEQRLRLPGGERLREFGASIGAVLGVVGLGGVLVVGVVGPHDPARNLAVLLVWVLWWAGFTASTYLLGNAWPGLDPFSSVARVLPSSRVASRLPSARIASRLPPVECRQLPAWLGRWPAVAGLLLLVWVEVVSDVASDPVQLAAVAGGYGLGSVAGSVLLGGATWRRQFDPLWNVFRLYGTVAPVQQTDDGLVLAWPGARLATGEGMGDEAPVGPGQPGATPQSEVGFVIALLWVTSYDGFVATPGWEAVAGPVVRAGLPPALTYFAALLSGYCLFFGIYWRASKLVRRVGRTYRSSATIAAAFAPALVPIAAGYHFGHYLPYFLRLAPSAAVVATAPLSPPDSLPVLALPTWLGIVGPIAVLSGHVLAVWVAHARAFELFTGKLQPIRSQYPYVLVMVGYTITGLWLLAQPTIDTPFL